MLGRGQDIYVRSRNMLGRGQGSTSTRTIIFRYSTIQGTTSTKRPSHHACSRTCTNGYAQAKITTTTYWVEVE